VPNEKKLREDGVFHLDEDLEIPEKMDFLDDNVFENRGNFTNHRMCPEYNNVFSATKDINLSEMNTAEGNNLGSFLENLVLNEL